MQYGIIWNYTETKNMKTRQNMFPHLKNLKYKRLLHTIKPLIVSAEDSVQESFFCLFIVGPWSSPAHLSTYNCANAFSSLVFSILQSHSLFGLLTALQTVHLFIES